MNASCQYPEALVTSVCFTSSAVILTGALACGSFLNNRLHSFMEECRLEKKRQTEILDRLVMMAKCESDDDEEEPEEDPDYFAAEQPPTRK